MSFKNYIVKHRTAIALTALVHILAFVIFDIATLKDAETKDTTITMQFSEPEVVEQEQKPEEQELTETEQSDPSSNKAVNKSAPKMLDKADYNKIEENVSNESKSDVEKEINERLKKLEQEVIQEQRDAGYGYTKEEAEALINSKKQPQLEEVTEKEAVSEGAVKGNTNISYKLENRYDTYMDVPVYMCEFGGEVTVNIVVNRSGKVLAAKIDKQSSKSQDGCLQKQAIQAAYNTRFNNSQQAPEAQKGSITFRFVSQ
ncbi:MAG: energy transducer TonB [Salibacter sp.]|uniref:energy transducer TonB family protein n=1 Tax=Salibacter sp. TaxID=2010995 RepID=UPI00286FEFD2|nr:energy transducer TonB [Salibacter sp.]MDR9398926.1 energy transducer TonB [Salibacter sp.]